MIPLHIRTAKDSNEWNAIVDESPFSVLHHKFQFCSGDDNALPLIIERDGNRFLFPLRIVAPLGFRVATSAVYHYASFIPDSYAGLSLIPECLESTVRFLKKLEIDLLVTSVPVFRSKIYSEFIESFFKGGKAGCTYIYAHMLRIKQKTFEEVWIEDFSKHARNAVRKAEKRGVNVRPVDEIAEHIDDMISCNISSLKRHGRPLMYPHCYREPFLRYLSDTKSQCDSHFHMYGAFWNDRLIAYMSTIEFNKLMTITLAMSSSPYLDKAPNDALIAYIIRNACENRFDWMYYSFGRFSVASSKGVLPGLWRFKFEHGFKEVHIPIYRLALTRTGRMLSRIVQLPSYALFLGASLPKIMKLPLQHFYDKFARAEKSRFHMLFHV